MVSISLHAILPHLLPVPLDVFIGGVRDGQELLLGGVDGTDIQGVVLPTLGAEWGKRRTVSHVVVWSPLEAVPAAILGTVKAEVAALAAAETTSLGEKDDLGEGTRFPV